MARPTRPTSPLALLVHNIHIVIVILSSIRPQHLAEHEQRSRVLHAAPLSRPVLRGRRRVPLARVSAVSGERRGEHGEEAAVWCLRWARVSRESFTFPDGMDHD